jgi:hypothetical protein
LAVTVAVPDSVKVHVFALLPPLEPVESSKFAPEAQAETVTLAGTAATPGLLLESDTVAPAAGAAAESTTVP